MIRKHIYIDNEQDRQVKEVAELLGVAEAEVIRRSITMYMNNAYRDHFLMKTTLIKENDKK